MTFLVPIRTISALNAREHHYARAKRVKVERNAVRVVALASGFMCDDGCGELAINPPVAVTLTRIASRKIDGHDGLPASLKGVADEIAALLGLKSDDDERVTWNYAQSNEGRGVYGVRVSIEPRGRR